MTTTFPDRITTAFGTAVELARTSPASVNRTTEVPRNSGHPQINGLHGVAIVDAVHHRGEGDRAHYSVRIIERDPGLIAAIDNARSDRHGARMTVTLHGSSTVGP